MNIEIQGVPKHRLNPDATINQQFAGGGSNSGVTNITESSEIGDALRELNDDSQSGNSRMSNIDMRAKLHYTEVGSMLAVDTLVDFNFLPIECLAFTRQKKRLSVSINGVGRQQIVEIVGGKKEQQAKAGGFMGMMGGKK